MIEAIRGFAGQSRANCICDVCSRDEVIPNNHERGRGVPVTANQGQAVKKLTQMGWSFVKNKLRCPMCEAKRRAYEFEKGKHVVPAKWADGIPEKWQHKFAVNGHATGVETMTAATIAQIREMTPKQKRLIIMALEDDYDDTAKRYKGDKTDLAVADELGDGIMFGWVSKVREELFGPSGENEELVAIRAEVAKLRSEASAAAAALDKRIDAVCAAVGPKAARA